MAGESPCFHIQSFRWDEVGHPLPFRLRHLLTELPGFDAACLGAGSLERLQQNLDQRLLDLGFVTSRVLLPPQQLGDGVLLVRLQLGRIGRVIHRRPDGTALAVPTGWMPARPGDVLDLRDIEQGVENAARPPSLAAQIAIEPGDVEGSSNLVIVHASARPWRLQATLDNEALGDFGRWQASASGAWDLGWLGADQISWWHQRSTAGLSPARLQQRTSLNYTLARGIHLFSVGLTEGGHRRLIQGTTVQFGESAQDRSLSLQLQHVLWRTGQGRFSMHWGAGARQARTFIEDTELLLQRRRSRHVN